MSGSDNQPIVTVTPTKDGPVMLSGSFEVVDSDGTHSKVGFES